MKLSIGGSVFMGLLGFAALGCEISETEPPLESRLAENDDRTSRSRSDSQSMQGLAGEGFLEYVHVVEGKFQELQVRHAKLVDGIRHAEKGIGSYSGLDFLLEDLTKKGQAVQRKMEALRTAKGAEWLVLKSGINTALQELSQAYDKAIIQVAESS